MSTQASLVLMHGVSLGYEHSVISGKALAFIVNVLIVFYVHLTLENRKQYFPHFPNPSCYFSCKEKV